MAFLDLFKGRTKEPTKQERYVKAIKEGTPTFRKTLYKKREKQISKEKTDEVLNKPSYKKSLKEEQQKRLKKFYKQQAQKEASGRTGYGISAITSGMKTLSERASKVKSINIQGQAPIEKQIQPDAGIEVYGTNNIYNNDPIFYPKPKKPLKDYKQFTKESKDFAGAIP